MTEIPEIARLREASYPTGEAGLRDASVNLSDAEQAVRDAVRRVRNELAALDARGDSAIREQAVRECVEALREEAARQADRYYAPIYFGRCADFLERTMLGGEDAPRTHTQECEDHRFIVHASTGDDADCICGKWEQDAR
jgi:hypothetical protein